MAKKTTVRKHDRTGTDGVKEHSRTLPDAPMGEQKGTFSHFEHKNELPEKYDEKKVEIYGYRIMTMKIGDRYTLHMPMGNNKYDKKMFDQLVYYNQNLLYAKTRKKLISQIEGFITNYIKRNPPYKEENWYIFMTIVDKDFILRHPKEAKTHAGEIGGSIYDLQNNSTVSFKDIHRIDEELKKYGHSEGIMMMSIHPSRIQQPIKVKFELREGYKSSW